MNKQEFENRVLVKVSEVEYEAIETVYMNSDLDKDEFCKLWCKMNARRVKMVKDAIKEQKRIAKMSLFDYISETVMNMANKASEENGGCQLIINDTKVDLKIAKEWVEGENNFEKVNLYYLIRPTGATFGSRRVVENDFEEFSTGKLYRLECSNIFGEKKINVELINEK